MATTAAGGAALGGRSPNPSDGGNRMRSPPGKGKPLALADITNVGRRHDTRFLSVADAVKENAKLVQLLKEKTRIIELSRVEMQKLRLALQASRQQNVQLVQANSQMLAELNLGKDRMKVLQHELSCTAALLKVKDSELETKNKAANQRQKEVKSNDVMKAIPSEVAECVARRIDDDSCTSAMEHHLVESRSVVPSTTSSQERPNNIITKRNKRKSESSECIKGTIVIQDPYRPHFDHQDLRKPVRRSTRLNPGSCEVTEVYCSELPEDDAVPPSFIAHKQHGPTTGLDMRMSLENECRHEGVMASGFKETRINEQPPEEANRKEIQEACSGLPGIEAHQIGATASDAKWSHSAEETQSSVPLNIIEPPKALEETGDERGTSNKKLKNGKDSVIEHINAKSDFIISEPLCHDEKRKSQRRKSAGLNSVPTENAMSRPETVHEDVIFPLPRSSSYASQTVNQKHTDGYASTKAIEGQVGGRRSLRRAAEKVVSYKEIPLNVKLRRP